MRVIGFVEGAIGSKGGFGLVGVPTILGCTAARGHQIALLVAGAPNPGREKFVVPDVEHALARKEGAGTFGVVPFDAPLQKWAFAPSMIWRAYHAVRGADFVSLHSLYSFPVLIGFMLARLHRKPYGLWPHGVLAEAQQRVSVRKKRLYDSLFARRIIKHASILFYSGIREREEAEKTFVLQTGKRAPSVVIPDGFDASEFAELPDRGSFRKRFLNSERGPLILFLARLNAKKGLHLLAEAMAIVSARIPNARLAIVGLPDPPQFEGQVRQWLREAGVESKTVLTGKVDSPTKLQAFADADVFVLLSLAENFGFSLFEAMASRLPVVVSDSLEFSGEIAAAHAGFAVKRDPSEAAAAIVQVLQNSELRREMGNNSARLAQRYPPEDTALNVERAIECILNRHPLPADLTCERAADRLAWTT
jgi:glycosyltransferase involved in cell wall biosynthesis